VAGPRSGLTERFLERVAADVAAADARAVERAAARALFDFAACASAGGGIAHAGSPEERAAATAVAGHRLDRDDLHWPSLTHPGGVVWPVLLALAAEAPPAVAATGYEVIARLGGALGPSHRRYWHASATAGAIGAAAAAALARGVDAVDAAGHAISVAGGSIQAMLELSGTRLYHRAHAAVTGITAARAAGAGIRATRRGLEAERGLFAAMAPDADPEALLGPCERLAIEELTFRLYGTTGFAHAAVEAARELAPAPEALEILVEAPAGAVALAGNLDPGSDEEAWWSVPHAVAATLAGAELDGRLREEARPLLARTRLVARDDPATTVTVDGRSATRLHHRGAPADPATGDDLLAKWRALNPTREPPARPGDPFQEVVQALWRISST
jgi:2-methylcitrate dehydratase PrpD